MYGFSPKIVQQSTILDGPKSQSPKEQSMNCVKITAETPEFE